jgi:hypothetical protein
MAKKQLTQQEFLRDAMHRLCMTRDEFAHRIAVKRKTLDNWLLPPSDSARGMPDMAWKFIQEILEIKVAKRTSMPPLRVYNDFYRSVIYLDVVGARRSVNHTFELKGVEMSSDLSLDDANEQYREACADEIATRAARLVAARDMERTEAIKAVTEEMRQESAASNDVTGTLSTMIEVVNPSTVAHKAQIDAIKLELIDAARDAADTL